MEESFILKTYGELSLFEQNQLTAEDRTWWLRRLKKKAEDEKAQMPKNTSTGGS